MRLAKLVRARRGAAKAEFPQFLLKARGEDIFKSASCGSETTAGNPDSKKNIPPALTRKWSYRYNFSATKKFSEIWLAAATKMS